MTIPSFVTQVTQQSLADFALAARKRICYKDRVRHAIFLLLVLAAGARSAVAGEDSLRSSLRRIFASSDYALKSFGPARWDKGGDTYTTVENGKSIARFEAASGRGTVAVDAARTGGISIAGYEWSANGSRVLIFTNTQRVWRQNTRGDYFVCELSGEARKPHQLGRRFPPSSLLFAKLSPDGLHAAYVHANNIYVEEIASGRIKQVTKDGSDTIVNGTGDWVNEEEFAIRDGFRWSPDGRRLAYWQFDQSQVGRFALINNTAAAYPAITWIPYPKVGASNSAVRIGVVSAGGGRTTWMRVPGDPRNTYLARMEWAGGGASAELMLQHLNRLQNTNDVLLADARTGAVRRLFRDEDRAWVDVVEDIAWLEQGRAFTWLSERDGWRRIYAAAPGSGEVTPVSPAGMDAMAIEGGGTYFIGSRDNAAERHLYRTSDGQRITPASQPGHHSYDVAPGGRWAFHTYSRFDSLPVTELISLPDHRTIRTLEDNSAAREALAGTIAAQPAEFLKVALPDEKVTLDGWMIKPPAFDPSRKYPLVMFVYGEPAGVTVVDQWAGPRGLFHRALAAQGVIVASVDNRGTPAPKGRDWRKVVYGSIGVLSSQDQAAAVKALCAGRAYLDCSRVGIWGHSGGGSNTLNALFRFPDIYRAGVSMAPVPDQTLYDTIYQERYMGLPAANRDGYRAGSPIHFAEGLRGKLLLIHGTGDDNVHYQGVERLANRLIELGKPFELMPYPNRTHSLNEGPGTALHVHEKAARFLLEHLTGRP